MKYSKEYIDQQINLHLEAFNEDITQKESEIKRLENDINSLVTTRNLLKDKIGLPGSTLPYQYYLQIQKEISDICGKLTGEILTRKKELEDLITSFESDPLPYLIQYKI